MLKRLIKYDMKAISRIAVPLYIAAGICSLLCCAALYFAFGFAENINSVFYASMTTGGLYFVGIFTIVAMLIIVSLAVLSRYYKSIFTDEGYLNMVIPVRKKSYLDSKIISSVIWFLLTGLVATACVFVAVVLPTLLYDTTLIPKVIEFVKAEIGITDVKMAVTSLLISVFVEIVSLFKDIVLIIASITLGSSIVKRCKILSSIVFYFLIQFLEGIITDAIKIFVRYVITERAWMTIIINSLIDLMVICTTAALMYFLSLYVLSRKMNLE
ncbi:MAG: hypothetical protein E7673_04325 [Ruminococcaceae bacterium]|nr:hypothetical protein [Oscillospiraceae bacterium]